MPDAVPRGDEVILLDGHPLADISMVKRHVGIPCLRQCNHLRGDIKPLDFVSITLQQSKKAAATSTANIESQPASRAKLQCVFVLANTVRGEMRFQPMMSNCIVAGGDLSGFHGSGA